MNYAKAIGWTMGAFTAWLFQYLFVIPVILTWRMTVSLFKVVGFAALLIFIPVIGWILLIGIFMSRRRDKKDDRRHRETMAALGAPIQDEKTGSIWTPWLLGPLKEAWAAI